MVRGLKSFLVLMIFAFSPAIAQGNQSGLESFQNDYIPFASVGQAFMGPLGGDQHAVTSLLVTNVSLQARDLGILFHHGVHVPEEFPVFINGEEGAFFSETIPRGGVRRYELTAGEFSQGSIALGFRDDGTPVVEDVTLSVAATSFIITLANKGRGRKSPSRGSTPRDLSEAFSSTANDSDSWLCSGFCWAISTTEGVGPASVRQRLGVAVSSVFPGQSAPEGAQRRILPVAGRPGVIEIVIVLVVKVEGLIIPAGVLNLWVVPPIAWAVRLDVPIDVPSCGEVRIDE